MRPVWSSTSLPCFVLWTPHEVSIPFIAGQWSLRAAGVVTDTAALESLNPLHCGAVVASGERPGLARREALSQSPSLRGSGRFLTTTLTFPRTVLSQSPSLRGSGRFLRSRLCVISLPRRLNPLHCGAVVASRSGKSNQGVRQSLNPLHCGAVVASQLDALARNRSQAEFQSPSLRGSGRFHVPGTRLDPIPRVSIPFIAGQWSLLAKPVPGAVQTPWFQSPSLRGSGRFLLRPMKFRSRYLVSIPFIAGQWSLHSLQCVLAFVLFRFQSPSLRGSGRFIWTTRSRSSLLSGFNPLHCGAVVASRASARRRALRRKVSIPFIAGQWSLRAAAEEKARREALVSIPFIAGQWSLPEALLKRLRNVLEFQSPSLRGSGRFRFGP